MAQGVKIGIESIPSLRLGSVEAKELRIGSERIWPQNYLRVAPTFLWLNMENLNTSHTAVESNTTWSAV